MNSKNIKPPLLPASDPIPTTKYHHGPPTVGSSWSTQYETRRVVDIMPTRVHNGYVVRYEVSRGWPRKRLGVTVCSGDKWCRWVRNGARIDQTTNGR